MAVMAVMDKNGSRSCNDGKQRWIEVMKVMDKIGSGTRYDGKQRWIEVIMVGDEGGMRMIRIAETDRRDT